MTIQEAIRSGRPFRRAGVAVLYPNKGEPYEVPSWKWVVVSKSPPMPDQFRFLIGDPAETKGFENQQPAFNAGDILATDWEVKP